MDRDKIGIYVNPSERKVVRITSPYWLPEEPEWKLVTNDPNSTLVSIRAAITEQGIMGDSSEVNWASIPDKG
ncbi:MAG: hypothetical protein DK304_001303 [Chloroflexi bacterium]|jgi:hypothetical protein|nr:MAG: hypothetical protein DK304_001303 [Chloroflexota bacterium]